MGASIGSVACQQSPGACCRRDDGHFDEVNVPIQPGFKVGSSLSFLDVRETLPDALSKETAEIILQTAPLMVSKAEEVARLFYKRICETHVELLEFFNRSNLASGKQPRALAAAIVAFASNVGQINKLRGAIELMAIKHAALSVQPHHYLVVHEVLMSSIEDVLSSALSPEIQAAWSESVLFLAKVLIEREEVLYREARRRNGGWRGFREFVVMRTEKETQDVMTFTFKPMDSTGVYFDFSPGQFLTVKVDPDGDLLTAPRHYTITSLPGMPYLQISVKKIPDGKVSSYLHEKVRAGSRVNLSPPFGVFSAPAADFRPDGRPSNGPSVVLLSAGIGITPMFSLLQSLGDRVVLAAHVDRTEESHAFRRRFEEAGILLQVHYTSKSGRPPKDFAAKLVKSVGVDHDWYICGPGGFMCDAMRALAGEGVDAERIHHEAFGPRLCPAS